MPSLETVEVPIDQADVVVEEPPSVLTAADPSSETTTTTKRKITPASERPKKKKKKSQMTLGAFLSKNHRSSTTSPMMVSNKKKANDNDNKSTRSSVSASKATSTATTTVKDTPKEDGGPSSTETAAAAKSGITKRAALRDIIMGTKRNRKKDSVHQQLVQKFEESSQDESKPKNESNLVEKPLVANKAAAAVEQDSSAEQRGGDAHEETGDNGKESTTAQDTDDDVQASKPPEDDTGLVNDQGDNEKDDANTSQQAKASATENAASASAVDPKMPAKTTNNATQETSGDATQDGDNVTQPKEDVDAVIVIDDQDDGNDETEQTAKPTNDEQVVSGTKTPVKASTAENATADEKQSGRKKTSKSAKKSNSSNKAVATKSQQVDQETVMANLSEESKSLLKKHESMRDTYSRRAKSLLQRCQKGLEEENFSIAVPETADMPKDASFDSFPDFAVRTLASLVEGSQLALSVLAETATSSLNRIYQTESFTTECITAKMKLLATRKCYIKNPSVVSGQVSNAANIFEDESADHMWRWEVTVLELLPDPSLSEVKKARSARKKLASQFNAVAKLLTSLKDADKLILEAKKVKLDKMLAKISQEEEKVLKFEREEEKARLALEAKQKKEAAKVAGKRKKEIEQEEKAKEKQRLLEVARKEKERKKQQAAEEKQRKKQEAAELKQKKSKAAEEKQRKEEAQKQMQKNVMMSFLSAKPAKKPKKAPVTVQSDSGKPKAAETTKPAASDGFDVAAFRSKIDSGGQEAAKPCRLFGPLSARARQSRKRRAKQVTLSVFVTVMPEEEAFGARPFAEQQDVTVRNQYKFLRFYEDVRPPYHGTFSKTSSVVSGRSPFGKDSGTFDYDVDSEAEWEEGDEEFGEDVDNEGDDEEDKEDDDAEDDDAEDDEDGWLAADDEIEEELDEETKRLRQMHRENYSEQKRIENKVSSIAPVSGAPVTREFLKQVDADSATVLEGFEVQEGYDLLNSHTVKELHDYNLYLDAFPPALMDEPQDQIPSEGKPTNGQEMSIDDKKTFARFVHKCTIGSKEKVVDELRSAHPSITSSRAQALRVLESIADKHKHPVKGAIWQVKRETLEQLGLDDLIGAASTDASDAKQQALKTIATFVHHCTFRSKEKVIDELRSKHESVLPSRAETTRILESMAEKKKHPTEGVYWEVKATVRDELGLHGLASSPPKVTKDASTSGTTTPAAKSKESDSEATPTSTGESSKPTSSEKKRKTPDSESHDSQSSGMKRKGPPAGSAALLQAFLKKRA